MKTILSIQSHVAYGYVGNRAAVFPLQRMGYNVIAINTVQFSNHTGYGTWTGDVHSASHIRETLKGVRDKIDHIDALLTGYLGDSEIGEVILEAIKDFTINTYACDPVMGDVGRGFFVRDKIPEFFKSRALPNAHIITPNQFELSHLTDTQIQTLDDARKACQIIHQSGPEIVLLTSLEHEDQKDNEIQMLASHKEGEQWIITTPKLPLSPEPNGAGDCTAALFLGHILNNAPLNFALEKTANSIFELFEKTHQQGTRELAIIEAQSCFAEPANRFKATKL